LNTVANPGGPGNIDQAAFFNYRVRGWENDINVALLSNWHLLANLTIQSPVITSYPQTPGNVGNLVPSVPSALGNVWTSYDVPLPDPDGALQAAFGVSYQGQEFADAGSTRVVPRAPTVASALQWQLNRYKVVVGVNNLFNQRVFLYGDGTGGGAFPGPGRTVYARLTVALY
jgi:outer membrane receptor for ferric coprogen and ferric-rhodotorulic acid